VLVSPLGGQSLVSALLAQCPESFAEPTRITDKKVGVVTEFHAFSGQASPNLLL
jgi:hypothetical protein